MVLEDLLQNTETNHPVNLVSDKRERDRNINLFSNWRRRRRRKYENFRVKFFAGMFVAICVRGCFETLEDIKSSYKVLNLPLAKRIAKSNENLVNYEKKILFFLLHAHRGMGEDYPGEAKKIVL